MAIHLQKSRPEIKCYVTTNSLLGSVAQETNRYTNVYLFPVRISGYLYIIASA